MKKRKTAIKKFLFAAILIMSSWGNANAQDYATVKIGNQYWCVINLRVSKYRNGDSIPQVQDADEWAKLKTGAWCYYKNNPENDHPYGKLYNWFAVNDSRGLAPEGYHIPSNAEWTTLTNNASGSSIKSSSHWIEGNGNNSSGFAALPGGSRVGYGTDARMGGWGRWWTSDGGGNSAALRVMDYFSDHLGGYSYDVRCGFSVRCLKD